MLWIFQRKFKGKIGVTQKKKFKGGIQKSNERLTEYDLIEPSYSHLREGVISWKVGGHNVFLMLTNVLSIFLIYLDKRGIMYVLSVYT